MKKYLNLAVEMYQRGCTIRQAVAIAVDARNMDHSKIENLIFANWEE
jgi:hypothetical protein